MSSISEEEISFEVPESWILLRLGDFCQVYNGNSINATVKQEKYSKQCDGYSFIATKDLGFDHIIDYDNGIYIPKEETGFKIAIAGSILLCMEGGSAGKKIGILTRDVCFGNKLCCFTPYVIDCQYLYYYLQSPMFFSDFFGSMTGLIGGVGSAKLKNLLCPIPPLAEQKRIVEKIEELMPLIEEYGKEEEQLNKLNVEFPDKLRKSILQQAVQGKLTERDPADEPASELLRRIKAEKEALIKSGKIKKEKPLPAITDNEKPFDIPDTWEWVRLGDLANKFTDGTHSTPKYTQTGIPFLSVKDMSKGYLDFTNTKFISREEHEVLYKRCNPEKGDLLITKVGTTGVPVIVNTDKQFSLFVSVALMKFSQQYLSVAFLSNMINSPLVQEQAKENTRGVGNKNWVLDDIRNTIIPLPPLNEQKRIVKRVEELLALCDELK